MIDKPENPYAAPQLPVTTEAVALDEHLDWPALRRVRLGLSIYYYAIIIYIILVVAGGFAIATLLPRGANVTAATARISAVASFIRVVSMAFCAVAATGWIVCWAAPSQARASRMALAAAVCEISGLAFNVIALFVPPGWWSLPMSFVALAHAIFALIYLRRLAVYLDQPQLAARAKTLVVLSSILFVGAVALEMASRMILGPLPIHHPGDLSTRVRPWYSAIQGLVMFVSLCALIVFLFYLRLIRRLRKLLRPSGVPVALPVGNRDGTGDAGGAPQRQ